jgi:uncharacterized repeat protein (TIGR02543 family)
MEVYKLMLKRMKIFTLLILCILCISSCSSNTKEPSGIKVTYELNGGIFQNVSLPIKQYYQFDEESERLIKSPEVLSKSSILKSGYTLEGWYTESDFKNKWDFEKDELPLEGLTLYAKWVKDVKYTYNVCYLDENNEVNILGTYEVSEGEVFDDWRGFAEDRKNYTPLKFINKDGTAWDMTYKHPGGETDLAINVFVEYIEGDFELVSTAQQLKNARTKNIYLLNDIDLQGEVFSFSSYSKIFKGNNYTIKNFKVNVVGNKTSGVDDHLDSSLKAVYGSLFGNLNNATISDVTFENVEFVIDVGYDLISKVYISPLCVNMTNSTISNVSINASYSCSRLHSNFEMDNLVVTQENYIIKKEESSINNVKINISKGDN